MNTMNNAKVIEALEKFTLCLYFEKLIDAKMAKITLFSIFPYTAAANLSDPHSFVLLEDPSRFARLNSGSFNN